MVTAQELLDKWYPKNSICLVKNEEDLDAVCDGYGVRDINNYGKVCEDNNITINSILIEQKVLVRK